MIRDCRAGWRDHCSSCGLWWFVRGHVLTKRWGIAGCYRMPMVHKVQRENSELTTVMMHRIHWCQEITKHPRREFDGWLVGGNRKALGSGQGQIYRGTVREMGTEKMKGAKGAKGNAALYMRNAPALHTPSKLQCSVVEASNDLQTATK